jgi:hypothetical protein
MQEMITNRDIVLVVKQFLDSDDLLAKATRLHNVAKHGVTNVVAKALSLRESAADKAQILLHTPGLDHPLVGRLREVNDRSHALKTFYARKGTNRKERKTLEISLRKAVTKLRQSLLAEQTQVVPVAERAQTV